MPKSFSCRRIIRVINLFILKNFHFLLGTHSSDDALVKERKCSTIVKHYHSLLKKTIKWNNLILSGYLISFVTETWNLPSLCRYQFDLVHQLWSFSQNRCAVTIRVLTPHNFHWLTYLYLTSVENQWIMRCVFGSNFPCIHISQDS